jgi:hypothetical protein
VIATMLGAQDVGGQAGPAVITFTVHGGRTNEGRIEVVSGIASPGPNERLQFARQVLSIGSVRRAAIIGPGLDYINKADGYDFHPPQTVQPFACIDSLKRLGLAAAGWLIAAG